MDANEVSIYHSVVAAAVLVIGLVVMFAVFLVRLQRQYLQKANEPLRLEMQRLQEQKRIAMELHDALGPRFLLTRQLLEGLRLQSPGAGAELQEVVSELEAVQRGMRSISKDLLGPSELEKGLKRVVEFFLMECRAAGEERIESSLDFTTEPPQQVSIHILRMVQEAVHNAMRHSGASRIGLEIAERKKVFFVVCRDNGVGIRRGGRKGLGLETMKQRAMLVGGLLETISNERGTTHIIQIPMKRWKK